MDKKQLDALISLLDDPDEEVFNHVKIKIISFGKDVIPFLENAWETSLNSKIQNRIENIIHNIQFDKNSKELKEWIQLGGHDLLTGAILVTQYQYPDLDIEKMKAQIDRIKQDVWLELNPNLTALEKVKIINHIFFDVHGFSGNTANFHAPQNSYINTVLEAKKGSPLSLSILYAVIAQSLNIPVFGVNLPEHFILAYVDENGITPETDTKDKKKVLFYINPFSKGSVFSNKKIDAFLKQLKLDKSPSYYEPCSNVQIVLRLIKNLIVSFEKFSYSHKMEEMQTLLNILGYEN